MFICFFISKIIKSCRGKVHNVTLKITITYLSTLEAALLCSLYDHPRHRLMSYRCYLEPMSIQQQNLSSAKGEKWGGVSEENQTPAFSLQFFLPCPVGICRVSWKKQQFENWTDGSQKIKYNRGSQENQQTSQRTCPLLQWRYIELYTPDPLHVHSFKGAFTLGVEDSSVESPNTMLVI
jgi:hypothetical protein